MMMHTDTNEAYRAGRSEGVTPGMHPFNEVLDFYKAAEDWRKAMDNHADRSYYGVNYLRCMRAYWLGRLRTARHESERLRARAAMR